MITNISGSDTILNEVTSRCERMGISLQYKMEGSEWYDVLKFCMNLYWNVDHDNMYSNYHPDEGYCIPDDVKSNTVLYTVSDEQLKFDRILYRLKEYIVWLIAYIMRNYPRKYMTVEDRSSLDSTAFNIVRTVMYKSDDGTDQIIVSKKSRRDTYVTLHEYIIGMHLNRLSDEYDVHTFMRTIGYDTDNIVYLEYIENGDTFNYTIRDLNRVQIESCLLQILFSIYHAQCTIGFVHRDLSLRNILVVRHESPIDVAVMVPDSDTDEFTRTTIRTDVEVKLIDYGLASIYLPDRDIRLVSGTSPYINYEYMPETVSCANDIMYVMSMLYRIHRLILDDTGLTSSILRLMYRLYTNIDLDPLSIQNDHSKLQLPKVDYDTYRHLYMVSPLLGPLYIKEAILQFYDERSRDAL